MLTLSTWRIGKVAVIHCAGRIVRSDAAFRLRAAVAQQREALVVLLDLSGVQALDSGGLGMLIFVQMWTHDRGIQLKVFDPVAGVRRSLERTRSAARPPPARWLRREVMLLNLDQRRSSSNGKSQGALALVGFPGACMPGSWTLFDLNASLKRLRSQRPER